MRRNCIVELVAVVAVVGVVACAGVAFAAAPSATGQAPLVHCASPAQGQGPSNDRSLPIGRLTTRDMSCSAARKAIRHGSFTVHGGCFGASAGGKCRASFTTHGFRCTAVPLGVVHCAADARRFSFGWSE